MSGNHSKRNDPGDHRRKWDREEYEKMAMERIEAEQRRESGYKDKDKDEPEPKRELLKARDYKVIF